MSGRYGESGWVPGTPPCTCGEAKGVKGLHYPDCPRWTAARSVSAEPTDALREAREEIAQAIAEAGDGYWARADAILALPAVRDLAVENRRLRETVERSRNLTPVRRAALVLSDGELGDALDLWYAQRAEDGSDG